MAGLRKHILRAIVVGWAISSLAAVAAALAVLEIDRTASLEASRANIAALWPFWLASISGWASLTAVWLLLGRTPPAAYGKPFLVAGVILTVAAAARVAVILTHEPALSDDVYRYVLDGRNTAGGINPYLLTPAEQQHHRELVALVNNPTMHTVYLPTSQWVFAATALATPRGTEAQASARVFRAVMVGFELAAISLVLLALAASGRSCWWAALYAWHPLPLAEIAGSGHQEGLGIFLLVAAIGLGTTVASSGQWLHTTRWTVFVALGALVKPMFLPVAAFLLKGRTWHAWVTSVCIGAAVSAALAAPLWLSEGGRPLGNLFDQIERTRVRNRSAKRVVQRLCVFRFVMNRDRLLDTAADAISEMAKSYATEKRTPLAMPGRNVWQEMIEWLEKARSKGHLTPHDVTTGSQIAMIVTGGNIDAGTMLSEDDICALERKAFLKLARTNETRARIVHMLEHGSPLRN